MPSLDSMRPLTRPARGGPPRSLMGQASSRAHVKFKIGCLTGRGDSAPSGLGLVRSHRAGPDRSYAGRSPQHPPHRADRNPLSGCGRTLARGVPGGSGALCLPRGRRRLRLHGLPLRSCRAGPRAGLELRARARWRRAGRFLPRPFCGAPTQRRPAPGTALGLNSRAPQERSNQVLAARAPGIRPEPGPCTHEPLLVFLPC